MQPTRGQASGHLMDPDSQVRPVSRVVAIVVTVLALASGITGLLSLSPETWGVGLIAFGCLLAIIGVLAQGAEHFARASTSQARPAAIVR